MKNEGRTSNYERMKHNMADVFLQYDQEKMIRTFGLGHDERYLYICFLARQYLINRLNGRVSWSEDDFQTEEEADYNVVMTLYDVLCSPQETCALSNEWVNVGSLCAVKGGTLEKGNDFFQYAGNEFDGKTQALARACEALQGKKMGRGDISYELPLFPFLPILLCFWDSDEEFSASLQIFVDKNTLDYMHYETLMFAVSHVLGRIKDEM